MERYIACYCIHDVLENGKIINEYKDENKSTYIVAGKCKIEEYELIVGVVVSNNNNKVYGLNYYCTNNSKFNINLESYPTVYALTDNKPAATINRYDSGTIIPNNSDLSTENKKKCSLRNKRSLTG